VRRRQFLLASALGVLAPTCAFAQARSVRIGMLSARSLDASFYAGPIVQRLGELGYRESAGMSLEYRSAEGYVDRYPKLARELIDLKCDLIFAIGPELAAGALRDARTSIPVVFLAIDYDPLEKRIVTSLSRPDGNITGVYVPQGALAAKRLEIMHEVVPTARRFLVLADVFSKDQLEAVRKTANAAGVQLTIVEFSKQPYDFAGAFETGRKAGVQALIGLASGVFASNVATISALLAKYRLPSAGTSAAMAGRGFLLSYGPDVPKTTRRVAEIGARILRGAKPADIPVEQADEYELVINAKTARALGLKIPESVLARATRIVQ
jgi:putative ABC transport system substrate-binding protein